MIDIHCHILPQVDDGSKSWDMSLEMCRMATDDGIEHIVATPHANERFQYNRQHLASNLEYLRVLAGRTPQLTLGCDFHLSYDNLREVLVSPERFTIEGRSRAGHETYFRVRELGAVLDIGRCPDMAIGMPNIFITHAHLDHALGIPFYAGQRHLQRISGGRGSCNGWIRDVQCRLRPPR